MRFLILALACAHPPPTSAPAVAPAPVAAPTPADAIAPRLFDAAGLRDGFVLGTKLRLRIDTAGQDPVEQRWEVVAHSDEGCTIATRVYDPTSGALVEDEGEGSATWSELEGHATFPADHTEVADDRITVPAGTFETRRYTVRQTDGVVTTFQFAKTLPGPPVSMVVTDAQGRVLASMVLLERTQP